MPNISMTVIESHTNVFRPVILEIVNQLKEITKIANDVPVLFGDDSEAVAQQGTTLTSDGSQGNTKLTTSNSIQIEVSESYVDGAGYSAAVTHVENSPVFLDSDVGVSIKPAYSSTDVAITVKYTSASRTNAERWRDDIKMRTGMMRDINIHDIKYHFPIPETYIKILEQIWINREKNAPYGQTFSEYILNHSTTRMTVVTNQSGIIGELSVAETQTRIQGLYDFDVAPEKPTKDGETSNFVFSFIYKFRYDKPVMCNMSYPVMVHNTLLPDTYIPQSDSIDLDAKQLRYTLSLGDLNKSEATTRLNKYIDSNLPIKIPTIDEFIPTSVPYGTSDVLFALCQVDPTTPRLLLNLNELGDYQFDSNILQFITEGEWQYLTKPYQSMLNISVYRGMSLVQDKSINVTSNLDVNSNWDLSMRISHRVRLSIVTDMSLLSIDALKRLRRNPAIAIKLLQSANIRKEEIAQLRFNCDLTKIYDEIEPGISWNDVRTTVPRMKTVMGSSILSLRLSDQP